MTLSITKDGSSPRGEVLAQDRVRRSWSDDEKRRIVEAVKNANASIVTVARRYRVDAEQLFSWLCDPRLAPPTARTRRAANNRLAPGVRGSRHPRDLHWWAFDQLPEPVANALRDSRSVLCPVAALRLVHRSGLPSEQIARFLRQYAAWTDWRVLAADFGKEGAARLRPDAPRHKPKPSRSRNT